MVYLIYGSPCSGKTTYINEHRKRGDLICDVDYIYSAISGEDVHDAELYTHEVACELHNHLLDIIRDRNGGWKNAYVTSLANTPEKVEEMRKRINADVGIFVDEPFEVCMERAKERPFYFQFLIEEWFATKTIGGDNG